MQLPVLHNSAVADLVAKFDQVPGLTKEEEFDLAVRLRADGDVDAAHRLITQIFGTSSVSLWTTQDTGCPWRISYRKGP